MKKSYERPTCGIVKTMVEMSLLAGSGNGVTKNDPHHGGEDNLSKSIPLWRNRYDGTCSLQRYKRCGR